MLVSAAQFIGTFDLCFLRIPGCKSYFGAYISVACARLVRAKSRRITLSLKIKEGQVWNIYVEKQFVPNLARSGDPRSSRRGTCSKDNAVSEATQRNTEVRPRFTRRHATECRSATPVLDKLVTKYKYSIMDFNKTNNLLRSFVLKLPSLTL